MGTVRIEDKFLFDLQGFIVVRGVLASEECARLLEKLRALETVDYEDAWLEALGPGPEGRATRETRRVHQVRLNGLPRLDPAFDYLIDHPRVLPYLHEFVGDPQLINTWSISKQQGAQQGLDLPGALPVVGRAGDLLLFSETVIHDGLPKTTPGTRSNLYFNYVHAHYNVMTREPRNCHHFYFPPHIRQRFTPAQRELTRWMEHARWNY